MTRDLAIELLKALKNGLHETGKDFPYRDEVIPIAKEALDKAIKALECEPCEDAISRQAAIDAMYALCDTGENLKDNPWRDNPHIDAIIDAIGDLPPLTPQQKVGRWIAVENEEMETVGYYCSQCDLPMETEYRTKFCPNCGCRMKGEGE